MKYINKFFAGAAVVALSMGFGSCVNDLDQLPTDPNVTTAANFKENPREYLAGVMAKCYSGIAVSGQGGPDGSSDISGLDGGTSQWSRAIFMLNEFTTDEVNWIWPDVGVFDLCTNTWGTSNANIFGTYSRFYTHIAICNDFLRLSNSLADYEIEPDAELEKELAQFRLEARALRGLSYYYVIDFFGNAVVAWDDMAYGEVPQQTTREELYNKVVADLEDVLSKMPDATPVYGRIGKDAVEALLCKYYLNAEVFTGKANWAKCWEHAQNIINRHKGGGFNGSGLANDYLALFCGNNDMFMPGGALADQNEILWGIPYNTTYTQPYGGTEFLIAAAVKNMGEPDKVSEGYMNNTYYGINQNWACMHARKEFAQKFNFVDGVSEDGRTFLWLTENAGFTIENTEFSEFQHGYASVKFTNMKANPDGTLKRWYDETSGLARVGEAFNVQDVKFPDTDLPIIRLADVYLMAAECTLHGVGDKGTALEYVNYVRERAGVEPWNALELNADNLLDERSRELYWENVRRTDLIRFGKFVGGSYNWSWKGNAANGAAIADHMTLFPIPADVISTYGSSYKQNKGY